MDLNERADISNSRYISLGRDTGSLENNLQELHQDFYSMDCNINRMHIESEFWHIDHSHRPTMNDNSVQAQSSSGSRRAKRQNFWGSTSNILNEEGPGAYASDIGEIPFHGSFQEELQTEEPFGYYGSSSGSISFDLLHTAHNVASSSSNNSSIIQPNVIHTGTKTQHSNAARSQGRVRAELSARVDDCQIGRDYMSSSSQHARENGKGKSLVNLNTDADINHGNLGYSDRHRFDNLESGNDEETSSLHLGFDDSLSDQLDHLRENERFGDIRGTYKRKISTVDRTETSKFDHLALNRRDNLREGTDAAERNQLDWARFANYSNARNSRQFDFPSEDSSLRNNTRVSQEPSDTPFHLPRASRDLRLTQPESSDLRLTQPDFVSRIPEASRVDNVRSLMDQPSIEHCPTSFGLMSSATPNMSGWGENNSISRRGNRVLPTFGVNERGFSGRTLDEMFVRDPEPDNRYSATRNVNIGIQYNLNSSSSESTIREMNPPLRSSDNLGSSISSSIPISRVSGHRSNRNSVLPPAAALINPQRPRGHPFNGNSAVHHGLRNASLLSARARREALFAGPIQGALGLPFRGLNVLRADGEYRRQFLSEILSAMHHAFRNDHENFEDFVIMDPSLLYAEMEHDEHSDMRLDVDNMSYEELLALEERIGNVPTGLTEETISLCLRERKYSSLDATLAAISQESDNKCCICQDDFVEEDELGMLECGHGYHSACIKQWLVQKNSCPICKNPAYTK